MRIYKEKYNDYNNSLAIVTISNLCKQIAEKEVKEIIEEEEIEINDLNDVSDLAEFCDINMLGLTDELCKDLNFEAIEAIVEEVHSHINIEVIGIKTEIVIVSSSDYY
jgi:hypothetical protein